MELMTEVEKSHLESPQIVSHYVPACIQQVWKWELPLHTRCRSTVFVGDRRAGIGWADRSVIRPSW